MTVAVKFSDRAWARMANMADRHGITVAQLLEGAALSMGVGNADESAKAQQKAVRVARAISLRERGWKIAQIAEDMGVSTTFVSRVLCANGARTRTRASGTTTTERTAA